MGQHDLVGEPRFAECGDSVDPLVEWQQVVHAEAVHSDVRPASHELLEVGEVGGVSAVADDQPAQIDAFTFENVLLLNAPS